MTDRYRIVMHKHYDLNKQVRAFSFTVQKKGWFFWSTVKDYSADGMWSFDRVFKSEEAAREYIERMLPAEILILNEYGGEQ